MLYRLQILHYKGFKFIDILFNPFMLLVGPNASGKSTLLDIFLLLNEIINKDARGAVENRASCLSDLIWKQADKGFQIALEMIIPPDKNSEYKLIRYEIALSTNIKEEIIIENENLWLIKDFPILSKHPISFPAEQIIPSKIITKKKPTGWRKIFVKNSNNNHFYSEITGRPITYSFDPDESVLKQIPKKDKRFLISNWIRQILSKDIQFFQLNSKKMRLACSPNASSTLATDGSNLPKILKYFKKKNTKWFNLWLRHIRTVLPIKDIDIKEKEDNRFLYLYITYQDDLKLPSWLLSDGTLRLLLFTLLAYLPEKNKIYLIEEPENGLHPLAIENVYQSLSSVYDNQVLLATHSPMILRLAKPKDILCFAKTENGIIDVIEGEKHPILKNWQKGINLATLHASGVLQ